MNGWIRVGLAAACYKTKQAQIPRSAGDGAGKSAGLRRLLGAVPFLCFSKESGLPALLPAVPFFPLFPAPSPALLWIWAFSLL